MDILPSYLLTVQVCISPTHPPLQNCPMFSPGGINLYFPRFCFSPFSLLFSLLSGLHCVHVQRSALPQNWGFLGSEIVSCSSPVPDEVLYSSANVFWDWQGKHRATLLSHLTLEDDELLLCPKTVSFQAWLHGYLAVWLHSCMLQWTCQCFTAWPQGCVSGLYGCIVIWLFSCMSVWKHSCQPQRAWLNGWVATLPSGCVPA